MLVGISTMTGLKIGSKLHFVVMLDGDIVLSIIILSLFSAALPSVRGIWVSSSFPAVKGLQVQWENSTASPSVPPASHFAVQWRSETHPSTSRWITVDGFNTSTVIQGATWNIQHFNYFLKHPFVKNIQRYTRRYLSDIEIVRVLNKKT